MMLMTVNVTISECFLYFPTCGMYPHMHEPRPCPAADFDSRWQEPQLRSISQPCQKKTKVNKKAHP